MPIKLNQKGIAPVLIIIIVGLVGVLGVATLLLAQKNKPAPQATKESSSAVETKSGPDEELNNTSGGSSFSGKIRVASRSAEPKYEPPAEETPEPYVPSPTPTEFTYETTPEPTEPPKDATTASYKDLSVSLICMKSDDQKDSKHLDMVIEGTLETSANIDGVWVRVTDEKTTSTIYAAFLSGSKKIAVQQEFHDEIKSALDGDDFSMNLVPDGRKYTIKFYEGTTDPSFVPESQVIAKLFLSKSCSF